MINKNIILSVMIIANVQIVTPSLVSNFSTGGKDSERSKPDLINGNFVWYMSDLIPPIKPAQSLPDDVINTLKKSNISGIFIWMGHFDTDAPNNIYVSGLDDDDFNKLSDFQSHLVYTFGTPNYDSYFSNNPTDVAQEVIRKIRESLPNKNITGIQLDVEHVNLVKYKILVDEVANTFGSDYLISLCVAWSWPVYNMPDYDLLVENVDFVVPMLYCWGLGYNLSGNFEVTDPGFIERSMNTFEAGEKPFYAGLPTYSSAQLYDSSGTLQGGYDAHLAKPELEYVSQVTCFEWEYSYMNWNTINEDTSDYSGDNVYCFKVKDSTEIDGLTFKENGYLQYNIVAPNGVKKYIDVVNESRADLCKGVALFRYYTTNPNVWDVVFCGLDRHVDPKVEYFVNLNSDNIYELILHFYNNGLEESYAGDHASGLYIELQNCVFADNAISKGDFDRIKYYKVDQFALEEKEDASESNVVEFIEIHLDVSENIKNPIISDTIRVIPIGENASVKYRAWAGSLDDPVNQPGQLNPYYHDYPGHNRLETKIYRDPPDDDVINDEFDGTYQISQYASYEISLNTGFEITNYSLPGDYYLLQNFPNPFNTSTTIRFDIAENSHVRLVLYNVRGEKVKTLITMNLESGEYSVVWDGRKENGNILPSGLYLYELNTTYFIEIRKMFFIK